MAIVREQFKTGQSSGGTSGYSLAFDTNITANSVLVCMVSAFLNGASGAPFTITDNNGNTWTETYDLTFGSSGFTSACFAYVEGANSGATTVTINSNASSDEYFGVVLVEVSGLVTTGALDVNNSNTATSSSWTSGNVTTTNADSYMIGFLSHDNGNRALTEDAAFTLVAEYQNGNNGMPYSCAERILLSTVTDAYTGTISTSSEYWAGVLAFEGASSGTTYNDSVSFARNSGESLTTAVTFPNSLTFARQANYTTSTAHTMSATLSTGRQMDMSLSQVATMAESLSFAAQQDNTFSAGLLLSELISFARQGDMSTTAAAIFNESLSFSGQLGDSTNTAQTLLESLTYQIQQQVTNQVTAILNESLTMPRQNGDSYVSSITGGGTTYNNSISYGLNLGFSVDVSLEASEVLSFAKSLNDSYSTNINAVEALEFTTNQIVAHAVTAVMNESVSFDSSMAYSVDGSTNNFGVKLTGNTRTFNITGGTIDFTLTGNAADSNLTASNKRKFEG